MPSYGQLMRDDWDLEDLVPDPEERLRRAQARLMGGEPRVPKYEPLPEPEAESFSSKLLNAGGSLLGWIGGTLDKFGPRQVRALASGHLEDIPISMIPFGGSLGIDDQSHNLSWDDVLTGKGRYIPQVIPENDPTRWELRDFVAPAIDLAINPFLLPKLGPLTQFGRQAQKLGELPGTLAGRVGGYTGTAAGLADEAASIAGGAAPRWSPLPYTRSGRLARTGGLAPEVGADVLSNLDEMPRTAEWFAHPDVNQRVASEAFMQRAPDYTPGSPLASLAGFEMPWYLGGGTLNVGTGPGALRAAGTLSDAADAIKYAGTIGPTGIPNPVPYVRNLFDRRAGNTLVPEAQYSNEVAAMPAQEEVRRLAAGRQAGLYTDLERALQEHDLTGLEPHARNMIRDVAERLPVADDPAAWAARQMTPFDPSLTPGQLGAFQAAAPRFQAIGQQIRAHMDELGPLAEQYGIPHQQLADEYIDYLYRRVPEGGNQSLVQKATNKLWGVLGGSNIRRQESLRDLPFGTTGINRLSVDPRFSGPEALLQGQGAVDALRDVAMPYALDVFRRDKGAALAGLTDDQVRALFMAEKGDALTSRLGEFAGFLGGLDSRHAREGLALFDSDPIAAMARRTEQFGKAYGSNRGALDLIARNARPLSEFPTGPGQLPLSERTMDVASFGHALGMADNPQAGGFAAEALKALGLHDADIGPGPVTTRMSGLEVLGLGDPDRTAEFLKQYALPRDLTSEVLAQRNRYLTPHEISPAARAWDSATAVYKSYLNPIWAASQVRNYLGGMYHNWATDSYDPRYMGFGPEDWFGARRYIQPQLDAMNLMRGKDIDLPPTYAGLGPQAGKDALVGDLFSNRIAFQSGLFTEGSDAASLEAGRLRRMLGANPTATLAQDVGGWAQEAAAPFLDLARGRAPAAGWDAVNPLALAGVGDRTEDAFSLMRAARQAGDASENMLRGGQGIALLRQGFTPQAAAAKVLGTHFDYKDLSDFEKNVMRRLMPFYTFSRKNLPLQMQLLNENPGKVGGFIRAAGLLQDAGGADYVPGYLEDGVAIPLGQEQDGSRRWISQTGIPTEEAFGRIKLDTSHGIPLPDLGGMVTEAAGMLNPMIKGPLEQIAGRQFFSGRDLADLRPTGLGSLYGTLPQPQAQLLTQVLANSPLSRFVSSLDKLTDPRKGWLPTAVNLGTGLRVSDVDMDKQRNADLKRAMDELSRRNPELRSQLKFYVPKELEGQVSPATLQLMQMQARMQQEAAARKKAAGG